MPPDPKPPTVEELVREAHKRFGCVTSPGGDGACVIDALAARARELNDALLNVAAMLHHDGGHWQTRPLLPAEIKEACIAAWSANVKAADKALYDMIRERDEARGERDRLAKRIANYSHWSLCCDLLECPKHGRSFHEDQEVSR